jgi:hypothetical protein
MHHHSPAQSSPSPHWVFPHPKKIITLRRQSRQNAEIIQLNPCMTVDEKKILLLDNSFNFGSIDKKNKVLRHSPTTLHVESFSFSLFFCRCQEAERL